MSTFENIMENGAFALLEQMLHFHIFFSNTWYFKGVKRRYYGRKDLFKVLYFNVWHCYCSESIFTLKFILIHKWISEHK